MTETTQEVIWEFEYDLDLLTEDNKLLEVSMKNTSNNSTGLATVYFHKKFGFSDDWICKRLLYEFLILQQAKNEISIDPSVREKIPILLKVINKDTGEVCFELPKEIKDRMLTEKLTIVDNEKIDSVKETIFNRIEVLNSEDAKKEGKKPTIIVAN